MSKIFFVLSILFFACSAYSEEIFIESEELLITNNPLITTFIENVYAFDKEIKMWSDKLVISYTESNNKINQIESFGNVKLIRENEEIKTDYILYKVIERKILASGNIILSQNGNTIRGNELTIDLENSTSIMKSKNQNRVRVKINKNDN
tara:strand:+ start:113 stop:562 length:450 start_codon:yes stop_codon:yes gene_type:complete